MCCAQKQKAVRAKVRKREERCVLAPKGLFGCALSDAGLVASPICKEVDEAWDNFYGGMKRLGYVNE